MLIELCASNYIIHLWNRGKIELYNVIFNEWFVQKVVKVLYILQLKTENEHSMTTDEYAYKFFNYLHTYWS